MVSQLLRSKENLAMASSWLRDDRVCGLRVRAVHACLGLVMQEARVRGNLRGSTGP